MIDYPFLKEKTVEEVLASEVYSEEFGISFVKMLEKYVEESEDMTQLTAIKCATKLLKIINEG